MTTAGWGRTGTLPRNEAIRSYTIIPSQEPEPGGMELGNGRNGSDTDETAANDGGRQRGGDRRSRMQRVAATLTLQRRQRRATSRDEVQKSLPKFWPVATILVVLVELGLLIALLVINGFAPIAFSPEVIPEILPGFGNTTEYVSRKEVPNFFIGPSSSSLIHAGAKYTPVSVFKVCMSATRIIAVCYHFIVLDRGSERK